MACHRIRYAAKILKTAMVLLRYSHRRLSWMPPCHHPHPDPPRRKSTALHEGLGGVEKAESLAMRSDSAFRIQFIKFIEDIHSVAFSLIHITDSFQMISVTQLLSHRVSRRTKPFMSNHHSANGTKMLQDILIHCLTPRSHSPLSW